MMNGQPDEANPKPIYAFGSFRFDPARGILWHGDSTVPLPERLTQLLALLIHGNGTVIDKETIASRIWPECVVSDGNLSQHMYMLRQLLDERARDRSYVVTVRGRGYRFVAPISIVAPSQTAVPPDSNDDEDDRLWKSAPELLNHYWRGCYLLEKRTATTLAAAYARTSASNASRLLRSPNSTPAEFCRSGS